MPWGHTLPHSSALLPGTAITPIPSLISHFLTHPFFKNICRVVTKISGNKRKRKLKGYKKFIWIPRCPEPTLWKLGGQRKVIKNKTNAILLCRKPAQVPSPPRYRGKPKNGNISAPKKRKTKAKQLDQISGITKHLRLYTVSWIKSLSLPEIKGFIFATYFHIPEWKAGAYFIHLREHRTLTLP